MRTPDQLWGLPDPERQPGFYDGVPARRLVAFGLDSAIIGVFTLLALPMTGFLGIFFLPVLVIAVSLAYRFLTLVSGSATWGMRLAGIELRDHRGEPLSPGIALVHVLLYLTCLSMVVPMLLCLGAVLLTPHRQTLYDLLLGTAVIRTPARD